MLAYLLSREFTYSLIAVLRQRAVLLRRCGVREARGGCEPMAHFAWLGFFSFLWLVVCDPDLATWVQLSL